MRVAFLYFYESHPWLSPFGPACGCSNLFLTDLSLAIKEKILVHEGRKTRINTRKRIKMNPNEKIETSCRAPAQK